jgi:hypothetical protein
MRRNVSTLSAVTAAGAIGSATAQERTSTRSMTPAGRSSAGVLFHWGTWSQATSCLLKKLLWRRMSAQHWPWPTDFPLILLAAPLQQRLPGVLTKCFASLPHPTAETAQPSRYRRQPPTPFRVQKKRPQLGGEPGPQDASVPKTAPAHPLGSTQTGSW